MSWPSFVAAHVAAVMKAAEVWAAAVTDLVPLVAV